VDALEGLRVVDMATVLAGPETARYLADFGADVIKVERPEGDGTRRMGVGDADGGDSYLWKLAGRGKRTVVLDLKSESGKEAMLRLCDSADVLIENLRPGALERLGLDPAALLARNPGLVVLRVTGFGQDGPYAHRPGFATMAEAMSGFAALNGEPDGAPLLPPIALTDEIAGLAGAFAVLVALRHRDRTGEGQVIDVNLLESMLQFMGALPSAWAHRGYLQPRLGAGIAYTVPRGTYRCADGRWVAISTSSESVAQRVLDLLGLADDPRFATFERRAEHREEIDAAVSAWVGARDAQDVLAAFERAEAAAAPVYTMADLFDDPHIRSRHVITDVGGVQMQGPIARLSRSPARLRHPGRSLGADTDEVLAELEGSGRDAPRGAKE
jgi:crotonobetainyl-CoA:carnitine CoA-transferase CaiB-like acyl-CoA transferase